MTVGARFRCFSDHKGTPLKQLRAPFLLVTTLSGAGALLALLLAGEPDQLWWWGSAVAFAIWAVLPMLAPRWFGRRWVSFAPVLLGHAVLSNTYAVWLYLQVSQNPQSSTDALIFVFGPICQWLALAITVGVTALLCSVRTAVTRRSRTLTPPPPP